MIQITHMIPANQLRIGNWYLAKSTGLTKESFEQFTDWQFAINYELDCDPILLTPEILEKFGFKKDELGCWNKIDLPHSPNILSINGSDGIGRGTVWLRNQSGSVNLPSCFHLHELQNLYFTLTGEELSTEL